MRYVVTGATGQLGRCLFTQLGAEASGFSRQALDITDHRRATQLITTLRPAAVINCEAYTKVDLAETETDLCDEVNSRAVEQLVNICAEVRCQLVHFSTDYVFGSDFRRALPYRETDTPRPESHYGRCKLRGEEFVLANPGNLVIRTCGLYSEAGNNFVLTIAKLTARRDVIRVVNDQRCSPTFVGDLVPATLHLLREGHAGLFHVVNAGGPSWYEMAVEITRGLQRRCEVEPISTKEYGAAAIRPSFSVLSADKYHATGGPVLEDWNRPLGRLLNSLSGAV